MLRRLAWLLVAVMAVFAAGSASVQAAPLTFAVTWPTKIAPTGTTGLPFTATVECSLIAGKGASLEVDISLKAPPAWFNATPVQLSFPLADCVPQPSQTLTKAGSLPLAPGTGAPGLKAFTLTAQAKVVGGTESVELEGKDLIIQYRPGHKITPEGDQTFEVKDETYKFPLKVEIEANAQTMIMFEDKTVQIGALDGLRAYTFDVAKGERTVTYNVVFTPPSTSWIESKAKFRTYSHCLVGSGCDPQLERQVTWTFLNRQPPPTLAPANDAPAPKGNSSGPELLLAGVIFLGAARLLRRRRT